MNIQKNRKQFKILRGRLEPGQCPECAVVHTPEMPHDQQSLFWQYSFYEKHERWPTWADALAHCTPEVRKKWTDALAELGVIVPNAQDRGGSVEEGVKEGDGQDGGDGHKA